MSKIIEKAFDAGKKIVRSIFLGSPNLMTSSDLNRQFEAIKYQLDQLDEKTGVYSDFALTASVASGSLLVSFDYSFIHFKGCSFSPAKKSLSINLTSSAPIAYLCLIATKETVTYDTDATHDIAGAKFEDGTSYAAANQIVYKNEQVSLMHSIQGVSNLVGVLAIIELSTNGNLVIRNNCIDRNKSLSMDTTDLIKDLSPDAHGAITNGTSYDEAFSIIENRFTNICPEWTRLLGEDGASSAEGYFRIVNGTLQISKFAESLVIPDYGARRTPAYYVLGKFPTAIESLLVSYFNKAKFVHHERPIVSLDAQSFVPYNDLLYCSVSRQAFVDTEGATQTLAARGFGSVCLILGYNQSNAVDSVTLGFILRQFVLSDNSENFPESGVINLGYAKGSFVYIPRGIFSIPLIGGFN